MGTAATSPDRHANLDRNGWAIRYSAYALRCRFGSADCSGLRGGHSASSVLNYACDIRRSVANRAGRASLDVSRGDLHWIAGPRRTCLDAAEIKFGDAYRARSLY